MRGSAFGHPSHTFDCDVIVPATRLSCWVESINIDMAFFRLGGRAVGQLLTCLYGDVERPCLSGTFLPSLMVVEWKIDLGCTISKRPGKRMLRWVGICLLNLGPLIPLGKSANCRVYEGVLEDGMVADPICLNIVVEFDVEGRTIWQGDISRERVFGETVL